MTDDYYDELPREIEVKDFTFEPAKAPHTLYAGGLGPCIAIGFYHPPSKSGYMTHNSTVCQSELEDLISKIKQEYGSLDQIKVYATGASVDLYEPNHLQDRIKDLTKLVEKVLNKQFSKKQVTIDWTPDNNIGKLELNLETGKFEIENEELELDDYSEYIELKELFEEELN